MKKILYSILTISLVLVLSSASFPPDPVSGPDTIDEGVTINGVTWATRNVGAFGKFATHPESPGMFYQWNCTTAYMPTGIKKPSNWSGWTTRATSWAATLPTPVPKVGKCPLRRNLTGLFLPPIDGMPVERDSYSGLSPT